MNVCLYDAIRLRRLWTVEKYVCKASAKLPGRRPPRHWTRRGQVNDGVMFGELRVLLLVCFRSVHGWMGMDLCVCVNVFRKPYLCADCGPWRKMSRA